MKKIFSKLITFISLILLFSGCPNNTPIGGQPDNQNGNNNGDNPNQPVQIVTEDPDSNGESELPDLTQASPFAGQSYCDEESGTAIFFNNDNTVLIRTLEGTMFTSNGVVTDSLRQWQKDCLYTYTYDAATSIITAKMKGVYFGDTLYTSGEDIAIKQLLNTKKQAAYNGYTSIEIPDEYVAIQKDYFSNIYLKKEIKFQCSTTDDSKLILEDISSKNEKYKYESGEIEIELEFTDRPSISIENGSYELSNPYITSVTDSDGDGIFEFKVVEFKWETVNSSATLKKVGEFSGTYEMDYGSCYVKLTKADNSLSYSIKDLVGTEYELLPQETKEKKETYLPILKTVNYEIIGSNDLTAVTKAQIFITDKDETKWSESTLKLISQKYIQGIYSNADCTRSVMDKDILDGVKVYVKLKTLTAQQYLLKLGIMADDYNSEVTIISDTNDLIQNPLTLEALNKGYIWITNPKGLEIIYIKNNTTKTTSNSSIIFIDVNKGDVVSFYGDNTRYGGDTKDTNINCDVDCYLYGNVMSLICSTKETYDLNPENFGEQSSTFAGLFENNTHIKNHPSKEISLPATKLVRNCYDQMFYGCTELTKAPVLVAEELAYGCYETMFYNCTKLSYVKCLAKEVDTLHDTYAWLGNVSKTGIFITEDEDMWGDAGSSTIPSGWIVNPDNMPGVFLNLDIPASTRYFYLYRNEKNLGSLQFWGSNTEHGLSLIFQDEYVKANTSYSYKYQAFDGNFNLLSKGDIGTFTPKSGAGEISGSITGGKATFNESTGKLVVDIFPHTTVSPESLQDKVRVGFVFDTAQNGKYYVNYDVSEMTAIYNSFFYGKSVKIGWCIRYYKSGDSYSYYMDDIAEAYGSAYGLPEGFVTIPYPKESTEIY